MNISEQNSLHSLKLKPIISYPREAEVGKSYLMTIDVQLESHDTPWPYAEEEYTISFVLDTLPFFSYEPLGKREPSIILHRFGGTYGPAEYLLTAAQEEIAKGEISITFVNGWGIPIASLPLECEVKREVIANPAHEIIIARKGKDSHKQEQKSKEEEPVAKYGVAHYGVDHYEASTEPAVKNSALLIETQLRLTGWNVLSYENLEIDTPQNLAIRTFSEDYVLVIDGKLIGMVRVRPVGESIAGVEEAILPSQIQEQVLSLKINITNRALPFVYETSGYETRFTNYLEPEPRSRAVFTFHRPETLRTWLRQATPELPATMNDLLRSRLQRMPPLQQTNLRHCQSEAISNLERSLAENRPRALIQMATGSGKTYMAMSSIYRLLKFGGARRILYLVDRVFIAEQVMDAFQQFVTPDDGRRFTDFYSVQLPINDIGPTANVCIVTIQRLYSILISQPYIDDLDSEASTVDREDFDDNTSPKEVQYKPEIPIEFFDFVIIDECHRSIYQQWRPVLEYFDAFLIGLTAVSSSRALAFFNRNLVMQYSREQALADGLIVDYEIYPVHSDALKIATPNFENSTESDVSLVQFGNDIITMDQIHAVLEDYQQALFTKLFPERSEVPKTLIFARDDHHADDIVQIAREVFGKYDNFVKKITYRVTGESTEELIYQFHNNYYPRIIVTVNMLLGHTIPPLEVLIFLRNVRSRELLEQMIGLGCFKISEDRLQAVTPDAHVKTHFIIVDATDVARNLS